MLAALALLPMLPAALTAETEPRPAEIAPAKASERSVGEEGTPPKPAREKLTGSDLVIKKPAREKPAREPVPRRSSPEKPAPEPAPKKPAPEKPAPEAGRGEDLRRAVRAGVTVVPVLPGPAAREPSKKAPKRRPSATAPPAAKQEKPRDNRLQLSVPRLGLDDVPVGDSPEQAYLDREGIMHLSGTGFPYERGSNTYIAGHAADYDSSRIPNVFRNLNAVRQGDLLALRDANGKVYKYRVYERLVVDPRDVWVTDPVPGKQVVSLQTCYPAPSFEKRLVVRGQLID